MTEIHMVLTDDWELRGDGSGNVSAIQFETLRELRRIYEESGINASFNVEVMQQLSHLEWGTHHSHLGEIAAEWEDLVQETYLRGHDVQLHVHAQWTNAQYEADRWVLSGDWSILNYSENAAETMISNCKDYLEQLLRRSNQTYQCVSFRSGSWCIAPSPHLLCVLSRLGIVFDMSIVEGLKYDGIVDLDYRSVDEPFLPYYPVMTDARRASPRQEPLVCVPTHSFRYNPVPRAWHTIRRRFTDPREYMAPNAVPPKDSGDNRYSVWEKKKSRMSRVLARVRRHFKPEIVVSDLSALSYPLMVSMIDDIRRRAESSGWDRVPVIIENHTKDVGNFRPSERFANLVSSIPDINVSTLTELASKLQAGTYPLAGDGSSN